MPTICAGKVSFFYKRPRRKAEDDVKRRIQKKLECSKRDAAQKCSPRIPVIVTFVGQPRL